MIKDFLGKVPAGMMIVPMFLSAIINTLFPTFFKIGGFTEAVFTTAGTAGIIGVQLVCMGAQLRFSELFAVVRRGGTLLLPAGLPFYYDLQLDGKGGVRWRPTGR